MEDLKDAKAEESAARLGGVEDHLPSAASAVEGQGPIGKPSMPRGVVLVVTVLPMAAGVFSIVVRELLMIIRVLSML